MEIEKEKENETNFDKQVKDYLEKNKIHLFILTPCYGGMCHVDYSLCLVQTMMMCNKYNIMTTIEVCRGDSLVNRARNGLIAKAMLKGATHMFFIDSDIVWKPTDILKLLVCDKPLVGGIYPKKKYNWKVLNDRDFIKKCDKNVDNSIFNSEISKEKDNFSQYKMVNYNFISKSKTINIVNRLMELKYLPTGFMMIKREVIEEMIQKYPETKYTDDTDFLTKEENEFTYALFDCAIKNGQYLSEDWLFCERYSNLGYSIYADVTIDLIHVGTNYFKGKTLSIFV